MAKKQITKKSYIATVNARIGSNPDGTARYHFRKGKPIQLTPGEARIYKNYI